ncbi:MAG: hypothetical protein ACLTW9_24040 [Enterocloster sp.]
MQKIVDIGVQCLVIVFCIVVMIMGGLETMRYRCGPVFCGPGNSHALYLQLSAGRCVLFIFYALIFIWEDVKELRIYRGQCVAGCPREKQKPLSTPGGCFQK